MEKTEEMQSPQPSLCVDLGLWVCMCRGTFIQPILILDEAFHHQSFLNTFPNDRCLFLKGRNWGHSNRRPETIKHKMIEKTPDLVAINQKIHRSYIGWLFCWIAFPWTLLPHFFSWLLDLVFFFWSTHSALVELLKPCSLDLTKVFRLFGICHF